MTVCLERVPGRHKRGLEILDAPSFLSWGCPLDKMSARFETRSCLWIVTVVIGLLWLRPRFD